MQQDSEIARACDEATLCGLIDRIVEQDQVAFEAFYDQCVSRVFATVRRIVRDPGRCEEVVEDAFFQVWREAPRFDPERGRAIGWVLAIARSRALDTLRRHERETHEVSVEDDEMAILAGPADDQPHRQVEASRSAQAVQAALALLEPQPRQLVSLAFMRGLTHEEVAATTGLPLGTVKSSIRRALIALRQALGADLTPDIP